MSTIDSVIDVLLIALVLRQIRRQPLTPRSMILPCVLVAIAGFNYLRPFRIAGNDLALILLLTAIGTALGVLSAITTRVWCQDGVIMCQAGVAAALLWTVGMAARFAFAYYSTHGGRAEVARFSLSRAITGSSAWTTALVLMAFGEVLARVLVLQARRIRQSAERSAETLVDQTVAEREPARSTAF